MEISYPAKFSWICIIIAIIAASVAFSTSKWWNTKFSYNIQKNGITSTDSGLFRVCKYTNANATACHISNDNYNSKTKKVGLIIAQSLASASVILGLLSVIFCVQSHINESINHNLHVSALSMAWTSFVSALLSLIIYSPIFLVKNAVEYYYGYVVMCVSTLMFGVGALLMVFVQSKV